MVSVIYIIALFIASDLAHAYNNNLVQSQGGQNTEAASYEAYSHRSRMSTQFTGEKGIHLLYIHYRCESD